MGGVCGSYNGQEIIYCYDYFSYFHHFIWNEILFGSRNRVERTHQMGPWKIRNWHGDYVPESGATLTTR